MGHLMSSGTHYVLIPSLCSILTYYACQAWAFNDVRFQRELISCGFGKLRIGVVSDKNDMELVLLRWIKHRELAAVYFDTHEGGDAIQRWIRTTYVEDLVTDFVVATENPRNVLENIETLFRNESRRQLAGLSHRSRWLILAWTTRQLCEAKDQQLMSSLDNVVIANLIRKHPSEDTIVGQIWAFMWADSWTRRPVKINVNALGTSCAMFPNTKYGLNGRRLKFIAKGERSKHLRSEVNPQTGIAEYKGILIDLIRALAQTMNFTYVIWPSPDKMRDLLWEDFTALVTNGTYDMGLTHFDVYVTSQVTSYLIDPSTAYFFDVVTGIYRKPATSGKFLKAKGMSFYEFVFLAYAISLCAATTLYFTIVCMDFPHQSRGREETGFQRHRLYEYLHCFDYLFSTSLNQGSLPDVRSVSARILIGAWGLLSLTLNAWVTSYVTANTATNSEDVPFNTFTEMIARHDYSWGRIGSEKIIEVGLNLSETDFVVEINKYARVITANLSTPIERSFASCMESMPHNFVLLSFRAEMEDWLSNQPNSDDYIIMKDVLFQTKLATLFPRGSEMNALISPLVNALHDTGILNVAIDRLQSNKIVSVAQNNLQQMSGPYYGFAIITIMSLLSLAVLLLIAEILAVKIKRKPGGN